MIITHRNGQYPVQFAAIESALSQLPANARIITDSNVNKHYSVDRPTLVLPPGEATKSPEHYLAAAQWLIESGATRKDPVVALGGGVIGDLAGFAAATTYRGMPFIQIPTSLLAMVDSSVGGKVGIDLPNGKNLLGAFAAPEAVWICPDALQTLPKNHVKNGLAEVLKYGFILDPELLDHPELSQPGDDLIRRCIELKQQVVEADEFETTGHRAVLNFGHTIGHAIEHAQGYVGLLHGEAISVGMVYETRLGERLGISPTGLTENVKSTLEVHGLPTELPQDVSSSQLLASMRTDKKRSGPHLAFSLLLGLGTCKLFTDVLESDVLAVLHD